MSVRQLLPEQNFERVRSALSAAFPDRRAEIDDDVVGDFVLACWSRGDATRCVEAFGTEAPGPTEVQTLIDARRAHLGAPGALRYYLARARHERKDRPRHAFTGNLPMVRVELPKRRRDQAPIDTAVGSVRYGDHLMFAVDEFNFKYRHRLGEVSRLELVTPARFGPGGGARFGAIALFLAYRSPSDRVPTHYVLEAGTATGQPAVTYDARVGRDTGIRRAGYSPTPFSKVSDYYLGRLEMAGDEIVSLSVDALKSRSAAPYLQVRVDYERVDAIDPIWPGWLIAQAAARVGAIGLARGEPGLELLFAVAAPFLEWEFFRTGS